MAQQSAGWLDRLESTRGRLWLLGGVLPRVVRGTIVGSRRPVESGIPPWQVDARAFGETAADELFVALSAMYRPVPATAAVQTAVEECAVAAAELADLPVADAHTEPGPLVSLGIRRRKAGRLAFEHFEYESRPRLPSSLMDAGYGELGVAHARILRHPGSPRPWVVWIHGAEQGRLDDFYAFRAKHLHHELGLNVAFPVLPHHGPRRDLGHSWPGFDLLDNVATMMRAVSDVRALLGWIAAQDPVSIAVVGMSLGGPVAALTSGLDDRVDSVCAMVPMLDAHATIAHHAAKSGGRGKTLAALLRSDSVKEVGRVVDPTALEPHAARDRRLIIAALGDRMTSVQAAQRLHLRWNGAIHWHPGGHVGHLMSGEVRRVVDAFLTDQVGSGIGQDRVAILDQD